MYMKNLPRTDVAESSSEQSPEDKTPGKDDLLSIWKQQFLDAVMVLYLGFISPPSLLLIATLVISNSGETAMPNGIKQHFVGSLPVSIDVCFWHFLVFSEYHLFSSNR